MVGQMVYKNVIVFTVLVIMTTCVAIAVTTDNLADASFDNVPVELSVDDGIDVVIAENGDDLYSLSRGNDNGESENFKHVKVWVE